MLLVRICYVHALGMIVGKLVLIFLFFLLGSGWVLKKENMGDDDDDDGELCRVVLFC